MVFGWLLPNKLNFHMVTQSHIFARLACVYTNIQDKNLQIKLLIVIHMFQLPNIMFSIKFNLEVL